MSRNVANPGTFGDGVIGGEAVAEERARVERLEKLLGPAGVSAVGLEHAQRILNAIVDRKGQAPEFRPHAGAGR